MQSYTLQELRCRIMACSSQLTFPCWPSAGSDLSAKLSGVAGLGRSSFKSAHAHISSRRGCHTSSGVCSRTGGEHLRPNGNRKRHSTSTNDSSSTHAERCHGLLWPSVFHPLLAGLPPAPPHSERRTQQRRQHQDDLSLIMGNRTNRTGACCETPSAVTDLLAYSAAVRPADKKKRRAATFYLIHTFHLHPYEAIVFEEAFYRFLGQRTKRVYEESCAAGASQSPGTSCLSTNHSDAMRRMDPLEDIFLDMQREDVYIPTGGHTGAEGRSGILAPQQREPLSQIHCQQRKPVVQQASRRKNEEELPTRQLQQGQGREGQLRSESTSSLPSVACAFLHHPPYRPAGGDVSCEDSSSSSNKEDSRARQRVSLSGQEECRFPRPSRAVIFGLSGQPAACVRDPETVLQQQTALFIRRFTGGGTVVLGSGCECFCVGLLLPHTFSHCRPYPQDLLRLSTSLYLGENIWEKQGCIFCAVTAQQTSSAASCFAGNGTVAGPKFTALISTSGNSLVRETAPAGLSPFTEIPVRPECPGTFAAAACGIGPEVAGVHSGKAGLKQAVWDPSSLYDLSPFAALRWGLLENDYVVTCPSNSSSCANASDTALPGTSTALLFKASDRSVGCCSKLVVCTPDIRKRPAATTDDLFQFQIQNSSQSIFKVGGNAQALSRQYGLQHTSFVWDEEQLQRELKDLLLLPKKQPKYRSSRPHVGFLRSVREGLKSYVPVAPSRGVDQEYERDQETTGSSCRGDMHGLLSPTAATEMAPVRKTGPAAAGNHGRNFSAAKGHANSGPRNLLSGRDNVSRAAVLSCAVGGVGPKLSLSHLDVSSCSRHASEMIHQQSTGIEESSCARQNQQLEYASAGPPVRLDCAADTQTHFPLDTPSSVLLSLGLLLEAHVSRRNAALRRCTYRREDATSRPAPHSPECSYGSTGEQTYEGSIGKLHESSETDRAGCCVAGASIEGGEKKAEERVNREEVWECVHCVVAADNKIPVEFKQLWALTGRLADSTSEVLPGTEAGRTRTIRVSGFDEGAGPVEDNTDPQNAKGNGTGRRLYVLPIEAVRDLVYELFEGSLKDMRSTRLIDASGGKISESVYKNIFGINKIIPV